MTSEISKNLGAVVISHKKNMGYGAAINSIFQKSKEIECDILVTFDADGQHRVEDIESVINPIKNNDSDMVIGSRFLGAIEGDIPSYRKMGIKAITNIVNSTTGKKITDSQSGFRAYNSKILKKIIPSESGMGVSTEILIKANKNKFKISEKPITIIYQEKVSSQKTLTHGSSVILSTMKFISIEHPLKFYGIPGFVFLAIGLFFVVWTLQEFSETRRIITNISLIAVGSTIFGMLLTMTSVLLYSLVNVVRERR
jgi:glycosyltransferase involved in cell wall biosynthesis